MTAISQTNVPIETLRSWLTGDVIAPGDERYDEARSVFAPGIDRRPAAIVRPVDALEVGFVVMLAQGDGHRARRPERRSQRRRARRVRRRHRARPRAHAGARARPRADGSRGPRRG